MSGWPASSRLSALLARAAHVVAEFKTGGSGTEGRSGELLNSRLGPEAVTAVVADGEADWGRTGCESTTLCSAAGPMSTRMSCAVGPCIVTECGNHATVSVTRTVLVVVDHTRYDL